MAFLQIIFPAMFASTSYLPNITILELYPLGQSQQQRWQCHDPPDLVRYCSSTHPFILFVCFVDCCVGAFNFYFREGNDIKTSLLLFMMLFFLYREQSLLAGGCQQGEWKPLYRHKGKITAIEHAPFHNTTQHLTISRPLDVSNPRSNHQEQLLRRFHCRCRRLLAPIFGNAFFFHSFSVVLHP